MNTHTKEFHRYVRPIQNPVLSEFCKQLTGIQQVNKILLEKNKTNCNIIRNGSIVLSHS